MEEEDGIDDADLLDDGVVCRSLEFDIDTEEDDDDYAENDSVDENEEKQAHAPIEFKVD